MSFPNNFESTDGSAPRPSREQRSWVLEVRGISAGYGDITAVWDVSLEVSAGEAVLIVGRNGAGKTTTLSSIAGVLRLKSGEVLIDGAAVHRLPPYDRVCAGVWYVQEGHRLFPGLTVEQNIVVSLRGSGLSRAAVKTKSQEVFDLFPFLATRRNQRAGAMSGGQQQLLVLAQAIGVAPKVLLLDEPSGGLAPQIMAECVGWIGELRSRGTALVIVEQRPEVVVEICREVITLENGRVVAREDKGGTA